MNENRRQILEMLAAGKITAGEAERLLAALEPETTSSSAGWRSRFWDLGSHESRSWFITLF